MHDDPIEFEGVYRYATREMVNAALDDARAHLDGEDLTEFDIDWLQAFTLHGTALRVHATLPVDGDRYLAAEVLGVLANHAIDGAVEARRGGRAVDLYPACCAL